MNRRRSTLKENVVFLTQKAMAHVCFKLCGIIITMYHMGYLLWHILHLSSVLLRTTSDDKLFYFFLMFTCDF